MEPSHTIAEKEIIHYTIRKGTEADLPALAAIEREVFPAEAWTEEMFRFYVGNAKTVYLVAEEAGEAADAAGKIAGYVLIEAVPPEGFINNVCVTPEYRRRGLARTMLLQAMEEAKTRLNVNAFTLEARVSNAPARALYESLGFLCEGIRPGYYERPREDAVIYWLR